MTYSQFKAKYMGKGIDFDGYYGFQCMDLAHQYAVEVVGKDFAPAPAAKDVWNQTINGYDKIPNTPTGVPQQGDIIIWGTGVGAYGHIAVFDNGDLNQFTSLDQNWPLNSFVHLQSHNYNGVLGWFHPQIKVNEPMATITQKELNEIILARDTNWNNLGIEKEQNRLLVERIETLKRENERLTNENIVLKEKIASTPIVEPQNPSNLNDLMDLEAIRKVVYDKWTIYPGKYDWKKQLRKIKAIYET